MDEEIGYIRTNYRNLILKEHVIPKLRENVESVENRVYYSFPKDEATFPLIIVGINDNPSVYDISQNEVISNITVSVQILHELQSACMDLEFEVSTCMLRMGFTRQEPTEPYRNENYGKFQIDINYRIRYNSLTGNYERVI